MKVRITVKPMEAEQLAQIEDKKESDLVAEVSARDNTYTITICEGDKLQGYAVFGSDAGGLTAVYAARSFVPVLGPMMMKTFLGVAQVTGAPIRVHTEKLKAMARTMGAKFAVAAVDADGIEHGVFA